MIFGEGRWTRLTSYRTEYGNWGSVEDVHSNQLTPYYRGVDFAPPEIKVNV